MKISLFLSSCMLEFKLPTFVSGNFSFDENDELEGKLINIEAIDGHWELYGTDEVKIILNDQVLERVALESQHFYLLERNQVHYSLFVSDLNFNGVLAYQIPDNTSFSIGNLTNHTIQLKTPFLNNTVYSFSFANRKYSVAKNGNGGGVYINHQMVLDNQFEVSIGDELELFGLTILFLRGVILVNKLHFLEVKGLQKFEFPLLEQPKELEIKDIPLYKEEDYYSKSPRLRRVITTKEMSLSAPPKKGESHELPLILVVGPMLTMGITSITMLANTLMRIQNGESDFIKSMPQLITSGAMLASMLFWPLATKTYNKRQKKRKEKEIKQKYLKYLSEKRRELEMEREQQKVILIENLISLEDCLTILQNKSLQFWDKRIDQSDFLVVRLGIGRELLDVKINYPEEGFTIEESELKFEADRLITEFKFIDNVPLGYSLFTNKITAIMGLQKQVVLFTHNLLLQLLTFYSYEDLKIVLFTTEERMNCWQFIKYLPHTFTNERDFRFFSTHSFSCKELCDYLNLIINMRVEQANNKKDNFKPHYLILIDGFDAIYQNDVIKNLTEIEENIGFSLLILENIMSKLPSKCNNFISLDGANSKVLKNAYDEQTQLFFKEEIHDHINMLQIAKNMANIPIEFQEGFKELPNSISFLEMEHVGKVSQLNIINRWQSNDATTSLKAEVGVDERADFMYLDLHEKYHGPHGLIAGMTGSGKSEFIITYILSMAINYSPDDVAFILIDYKGGGLAFAFENKTNGIVLPHLAGTITNLDKAEMDRTLVSIDSEIKRRQQIFNEARDALGESTIDIYKYQRFYKEGRLKEPIPHLFIISDEFAELKAQQPEFMDNLISVARIGRSLGVHLILATQKPSGVVNDQIWSNTKFRVCLKVQDESDSKEMLKRPEAASLKQTGRFYLQVGYDEYFSLGQSAWCGAKYYPSDKIIKQVDKSVNYINEQGRIIKSIEASNSIKIEAQGEQLSAILNEVISVSQETNKKARRLWLPNIPEILLEEELEKRYQVGHERFHVTSILGEYDAPERQEQGLVLYDFLKDGNTIIYGNDGAEREMLLNTLIYSSIKNHGTDELNYYIIDYGSESLRKYKSLLHVGGIVFAGEDEKFYNLLKLIKEEITKRKKLFSDFGGDYFNYIQLNKELLPIKVIIINNYDSVYENYPELYEELPELVRDSERYGIVFIFTCNAVNSIPSKISGNCQNNYAFKLKDVSDYITVFGLRTKMTPRDLKGRGFINNDGLHEFQVCRIKESDQEANEYLLEFVKMRNSNTKNHATKIPVLPSVVRLQDIKDSIKDIHQIPIGISKKELDVVCVDYFMNLGNIITSNKLSNMETFVRSLLYLFRLMPNTNIIVLDVNHFLNLNKMEYPNYYTSDMDKVLDQLMDYVTKLKEIGSQNKGFVLVYGINKLIDKLEDKKKFEELIKVIKAYENITVILVDDASKIKSYSFESWFTSLFSTSDGIWIGRGLSDQNLLRLTTINKEMTADYKNDMGFYVSENVGTLCKFIDFYSKENEDAK